MMTTRAMENVVRMGKEKLAIRDRLVYRRAEVDEVVRRSERRNLVGGRSGHNNKDRLGTMTYGGTYVC